MKVKIWTREEFRKNTGRPYATYWNSEGAMDYLYGKVVEAVPTKGFTGLYNTFTVDGKWIVNMEHTHIVENITATNKAYNGERVSVKGLQDFIKSVQFNAKKGVTTVVLQDGRKGMARCSQGDEYDVDIGFALALANALFGSKTQAHKYVNRCLEKQSEKESKKKQKLLYE